MKIQLKSSFGIRRIWAAGLSLIAAPYALGQQATPTAPESATASLGEIVVTAQKREERAQDVPVSIAVLNGDALLDQGADKLEDYVARVPGLSLNSRGLGQQQLSIRGISTGPQYAGTVATYIDEAPVGASDGGGAGGLLTPDIDSIDLARIEVLRGPQGTLYGASNIGGLVKYVTVTPDTTRFATEAAVEGETLDHGGSGYSLKGRVNLPVIENRAAILISAYDRVDPGFISDDGRNAKEVDETRTRGARVAFLATPIDGLSIKAAAIGQNRSADGFAAVDSDPLTLQPLYGDYQQRRGAGSEYFRNEYRLYYLTVAYDFGWAQFTETTSYNTYHTKSSQDYTQAYGGLFPPPYDNPDLGIAAVYEIPQNKLTQEVRLSGNVHSLEWVIGGYFDHENSDTVVTLPTYEYATGAPVDLPGLLYADTIGHYFGKAIFGQLTYQFTRQFGVTVGGRYAKDEANSTATTSGALVGPESVVYASSEDTATTYTFAPTYKITDNLTAYARVATGFRPGGSNPGYAPEPTFGPDKVTNYEAGLKGDFLDHRVSFEADGFHVDWSGVQLQLRNDQGLGYTANAGKAGSNGFEGSLAYSPVNALTFRATATYTDAKLDRDILTGGNIYGLSGDPLPYSPPWKVAVSGDYTTPISGNWSAFAGASFFYTDRVAAEFATSADAPRLHFPSYETVDARLGVTRRDWTLSLIAKNLFDERGFNGQVPLTLNPTGATALSIIQPRSVLLSLSYSH